MCISKCINAAVKLYACSDLIRISLGSLSFNMIGNEIPDDDIFIVGEINPKPGILNSKKKLVVGCSICPR
jgi:hypothetical protein